MVSLQSAWCMNSSKAAAGYLTKGLEYIGKGVNIFKVGYLEPPTNARVLKVTADNVETTPVNQTDAQEIYGSNFAVFTQNFSVEAGLDGSYEGFTGSVQSKFASSTRDSIDTKFAHLSLISSGSILSFSTDPVVLRRYLDADFKNALAVADPRDLIKQYGTHVAIKVTIGGMISYYSYSKTTEHLSDIEFETAAKARYKVEGAEVGANTTVTDKEKKQAKTVEGSAHLFVNGGSNQARIAVEHGDKDSYKGWADTIEKDPGFLGFHREGLYPIWELTDDKARREAIHQAFLQEAARQFQISIFTYTGPVAQHPQARIHMPKEYKMLAGGARDNWSDGGNLLTASFPDGDSTWIGRGKDHHEVSPASISVFAIGIYDNLDLWEVKLFSATGDIGQHPSAEVAIDGDFVLVGGGAVVVNQPGADKLLTSSYPKNATTWAANATDPQNSNSAAVTVFALGLRCKIPGVKIEVKTNHVQSLLKAHPSEKCSPDSGFALTGGGAFVDYGTGPGNLLTSSYPENDHTWAASSKDHIEHSPATITAYAIGLKVS